MLGALMNGIFGQSKGLKRSLALLLVLASKGAVMVPALAPWAHLLEQAGLILAPIALAHPLVGGKK
jgi:hypothetical protein